MAFLSKKDVPEAKKKPKSALSFGSLFGLNIGATLRPLGETGKMLVTLIAAIFASNGLFPRNHPALHNVPGAHLTLFEVLGIGWSNVRFTKEDLPRSLIFFAVILSLGLSSIAVLAALMHIFVGHAHAQITCLGPTCFTAPGDTGFAATSTDLAINWMNWLFLDQAAGTDPLQSFSDPSGGMSAFQQNAAAGTTFSPAGIGTIQGALINALGMYSYCMLVIGALVLFYHLAAMVTETAHHGVVMGRRANQVWAPIRLVTAVGLLVPVGAIGFGTGLNSGQYIILQVAKWGTGLASNVWGFFLTSLTADDFNFVAPVVPYARSSVTDTYLAGACISAYDEYSFAATGGTDVIPAITDPYGNATFGIMSTSSDNSTKISYTPTGPNVVAADNDLCGYYILPPPQQSTSSTYNPAGAAETAMISTFQQDMYSGATNAFGQMTFDAYANGITDVLWYIPAAVNPLGGGGLPPTMGGGAPWVNDDIDPMVSDYMQDIQTDYASLVATAGGTTMANVATYSTNEGWASAGTWFNTIARIQGDFSNLSRDMMPKTAPPQVESIVHQNPSLAAPSLEASVMNTMSAFQQWIYQGYGWSSSNGVMNAGTVAGAGSADQQEVELAAVGLGQQASVGESHYMDRIFEVIDIVASMNGVWHSAVTNCTGSSCFTLGVQFTTANPIAEIAALGHANINAAYQLYDDYIELGGLTSGFRDFKGVMSLANGAAGGSILSGVLGLAAQMGAEATQAIGTIIGGAVVVFFTAGFLLAYFLPLIPFYRFFFATLSWFLSLFEAMIAVPLIALAHLTPEGEGFMGEKAKTAYYFVFNIFLKPVLMVFGLITGYLIFCLAVSMMNLLFTTAVSGAGGVSSGHFTLGRLVYSILYVVILYLCCNKCFQLIDWLPDHAIRWMGAQGLQHAQMGDPMEVGGYMGGAAGFMESRIVSGTGAVMQGPAGAAILGGLAGTKAAQGAVAHLGALGTAVTGNASVGSAISKTAGAGNAMYGAGMSALGKVGGGGAEGFSAGGNAYRQAHAQSGDGNSVGEFAASVKGGLGGSGEAAVSILGGALSKAGVAGEGLIRTLMGPGGAPPPPPPASNGGGGGGTGGGGASGGGAGGGAAGGGSHGGGAAASLPQPASTGPTSSPPSRTPNAGSQQSSNFFGSGGMFGGNSTTLAGLTGSGLGVGAGARAAGVLGAMETSNPSSFKDTDFNVLASVPQARGTQDDSGDLG